MDKERRRFTRVPFEARVIIKYQSITIDAKLVDISLNGALAKCPHTCMLSIGDSCEVTIDMGETHTPIQYDAHIVHIQDKIVGLQCQEIPAESASALKELMARYLADDELLHREIDAMVSEMR